MKVIPDPTGPGQESVWSYPRPAVAEPSQRRLKIVHRDVIIADTRKGIRTVETSHPPTYYFPPADIAPSVLQPSRRRSFCEWKGEAIYFDVVALAMSAKARGLAQCFNFGVTEKILAALVRVDGLACRRRAVLAARIC